MATKKQPQDRKPKLDLSIKRPTKGVELCLDLSTRIEWEQAEAELVAARKDATVDQRMAGNPTQGLAKKITELEAAMAAATVVFRLEGLPRREWSQLKTEHPPRKGEDGDKALGVNEATFFDPAIVASITGVTGPDGEDMEWDPESWVGLADEMTNQQYEDFKIAVLTLNALGGARLPKSVAASLVMARSAEN